MTIMDAGSWVGDLFQKFESICVEVEEVIYEVVFLDLHFVFYFSPFLSCFFFLFCVLR